MPYADVMTSTPAPDADFHRALRAAHQAGYRVGLLLPDGPQVDVMAAVRPGRYEPGSRLDDTYGWAVLSGIHTRREDGRNPALPIRWLPDGPGRWNVSLAQAFIRCLNGPETWSVEHLSSLHLASVFDEARVETYQKPKWKQTDFLETPLLVTPRGEDATAGQVLLDGHDQLELARRSRVQSLPVYVLEWAFAEVCWRVGQG